MKGKRDNAKHIISGLMGLSGAPSPRNLPAELLEKPCSNFDWTAELGQTEYTHVWRGSDATTEVVAKVARNNAPGIDVAASMLAEEFHILTTLDHQSVVKPIDFVQRDGTAQAVLITRYAGDLDLSEWVRVTRPSRSKRRDLLLRVVETLSDLHRVGLVHGDLKPSHIIVRDDNTPVLIDFGLAQYWRDIDEGVQLDHRIGGTQGYAAPELLKGEGGRAEDRPHPRQDVYALGKVAQELCGSDVRLWRCLKRATHDDPEHRPQDATELLSQMRRVLNLPRKKLVASVFFAVLATVLLSALLWPKPTYKPHISQQPDETIFSFEDAPVRLARHDPGTGMTAWTTLKGDVYLRDAAGEVNSVSPDGRVLDLDLLGDQIAVSFGEYVHLYDTKLNLIKSYDAGQTAKRIRMTERGFVSLDQIQVKIQREDGLLASFHPPFSHYAHLDADGDAMFFIEGESTMAYSFRSPDKPMMLPILGNVTCFDSNEATGRTTFGFSTGVVCSFSSTGELVAIDLGVPLAWVMDVKSEGYAAIAGQIVHLDWENGRVLGRYGVINPVIADMRIYPEKQGFIAVSTLGVDRWEIEDSH
ncbi:MAG: protein kinase [Planctomycetota bacterium]